MDNAAELRECQEYDVRIVDGTMPWNGRLEVCLGGLWGAVCEDQFEDTDATVACRHLGYPTTSIHTHTCCWVKVNLCVYLQMPLLCQVAHLELVRGCGCEA